MSEYSASNECIAAALEQLDEARSTRITEERARLLAPARETVQKCLRIASDDVEVNYVAGLVMYHSFCLESEYGSRAETYLQNAVNLSPEHEFARLYLGHYYYDTGEYQKALAYFETIEEDYFLSMGQRWRILKLHELILSCKVFLNSPDITTDSFELLAQEYLNVAAEDVPLPLELVSTLASPKVSTIWNTVDRIYVRDLIVEMTKKLSFYDVLKDLVSSI